METRVIKVDPGAFDPAVLEPAAAALRSGGIVGLPTETVYGLAVDLDRPESVQRLLDVRESPGEKRITLHAASVEDAQRHVRIPGCGIVRRLVTKFWPGPLTVVFPSADGLGLGVRVPNHPIAIALLKRAGVRVGAPSANLSGQPPATTGADVVERFAGRIDVIIDAGPARHRLASTVVRVKEGRLEVLREGAIPKGMIDELNVVTILFVCTGNTCRSPMAERLMSRLLARRLGVDEDDLEGRGFRVLSAGTAALFGSAATEQSIAVLGGMGLDLTRHRAQPVSMRLLEEADRIYVMTKTHLDVLSEMVPECAAHIAMLDPEDRDIPDPIGSGMESYRECARRIQEALEKRAGEFS